MDHFSLAEQEIDAAIQLIQLAGEISRRNTTDDYTKSKPKQQSQSGSQKNLRFHQPIGKRKNRKSDGFEDVKAEEEEVEEQKSSDLISYITDDDEESSPAVKTGREERERGGGSKSDLYYSSGEVLCRRKRKFRSLADIYRTTKALNDVVSELF